MQLSDAIVSTLRDLGVRVIFGISGANIEHIHDAINRLGQVDTPDNRLKSVLTKSESGAAFMADGYARTRKQLGVCCATSGGGMMNLAAGIAESQTQGVPVFALVGQIPLSQEGKGGFQDSSGLGHTINSVTFWQSITKYTTKITLSSTFWKEFHRCLWCCVNGTMGASVMLLPRDMMELEVGLRPEWFIQSLSPAPFEHSRSINSDVAFTEKMLNEYQHPLLMVGEGADRELSNVALQQFIKKTNIAVATTLGDISAINPSAKQYLGCVGVAGHPSVHRYIEEKVDLVIAVGTALDVMTIAPVAEVVAELPLIVVNRRVANVNAQLNPSRLIEADTDSFFKKLLLQIEKASPYFHSEVSYQFTRQSIECWPDAPPSQGLSQSRAINIISQFLENNSHLVFDAGNCAVASAHYLKIPEQCTTTIALGMGGMGYGVAASVGIQLARQENPGTKGVPTIAFCGDGAFLVNGFEIHTAIELKLPILWFVFNNNQHGMCVSRQRLYFESRQESTQYTTPISIATIVKGMGLDESHCHCVSEESTLLGALKQYFSSSTYQPCVIELNIEDNEIPPFTPFIEEIKRQTREQKIRSISDSKIRQGL